MATAITIETERVKTGNDYTSKIQPLVCSSKRGEGNDKLYSPLCVAVDKLTGNIYIVDYSNNCVKVFDSTAKYIFKFGDSNGEGKMFSPRSLVICRSRILITHDHDILNYNLDGEFISRIGKHGKGELEFDIPWGIAINESNDDIYICDSNNNRIQILSQDFQFESQFGSFKYPCDVKLSKEYIYVLDTSNPCIHLFNHNHILQKRIISRGQGNQVIDPQSFFIDNSNNILYADYSSNSISIFNPEFQSIHNIPVSEQPTAVTVDNHDRVIVIFRKKNGCVKYLEIPLVSEIDNIIGFYHNVTHPGLNTTIDGIRNKYDWNGIYNDVGSYIRTCHDCQTSAALPPQPQRELQPIPPPEEPWCHCGIDLVRNKSRTVLGFQHILVIVCYLSKFVIARPLKTKTSKEILDCLQVIYLSFGVPKILQHDQGTEFSSKITHIFYILEISNCKYTK
ncbi:PEP-CTERM domain protein [Oopsacas minuta]|uniref:PEP-CTERM domain protein n=1 Tax=Oopsacas minuta TaxID=111878 RepID=A0AAV7KFJ3_9METZ|nr:PEP-CTERM domain protein [Oopsacas minuta]